jgi:transposase
MMLTLLIYCDATGTYSSRWIMRRCEEDATCRIIFGEDVPDFREISEFRRQHLTQFQVLFMKVLKLCAAAGLAQVGWLALDGTKMKANASRHKAMSYDQMQTEVPRLQQIIAEVVGVGGGV